MKWLLNTKNQRNILIGIVIVLAILFKRCSTPSSDVNTLNQNVAALSDSIRIYKTKNSQLINEKTAFISENGNLKNLNRDLYNEIQYLKDNPIVVIQTKIVIKHDTIYVPVNVGDPVWNSDSSEVTRNLTWHYYKKYGDLDYKKLGGNLDVTIDTNMNLKSGPMHITTDELGMSITTGLTENKEGLLEIFVTSKYPGFSVTKLDGALIDPKKSEVLKKYFLPKRWALGVYGGYGVYGDIINARIGTGIQLGIGIQYNLIQWNFKK